MQGIQILHGAGTYPTIFTANRAMIRGQIEEVERLLELHRNELDKLERELENPIRHSLLEEHTKGSAVNKGPNIPDTVAVEQCDPALMPTEAFTQTPSNQQTQKTSRPGIETFSPTTREARDVGRYDNGPTIRQTYPWEHPALSPTSRLRYREQDKRDQGTSGSQERRPLEQNRGPSERTTSEIVIEISLQLTFTHNNPPPEHTQHKLRRRTTIDRGKGQDIHDGRTGKT